MRHRLRSALAVVCASLALVGHVEAAKESYLLIISGLGGEPTYGDRFYDWAVSMRQAASERFGLLDENIWYLAEDPERDPARIRGKSTKQNVLQAMEDLAERARPGDLVFILLMGHGSYRSGESRFNLPGPDLTPADLAAVLDRLSTQKVVFVNTASASGGFVQALSGDNRVVVTATKTGLERNETVFGGYFVQAYAEDVADVNKDDRVSVQEAFGYARAQVERFYEEGNRLQTEHALLDDNGDGRGTHDSDENRDHGLPRDGDVAASFILTGGGASASSSPSTEDPELVALYEQAQAVEDRVEVLKQQKDSMPSELYFEELEKLLLDLATKRKAIRELEQKIKERAQS